MILNKMKIYLTLSNFLITLKQIYNFLPIQFHFMKRDFHETCLHSSCGWFHSLPAPAADKTPQRRLRHVGVDYHGYQRRSLQLSLQGICAMVPLCFSMNL
jgi:hypothetical protein